MNESLRLPRETSSEKRRGPGGRREGEVGSGFNFKKVLHLVKEITRLYVCVKGVWTELLTTS